MFGAVFFVLSSVSAYGFFRPKLISFLIEKREERIVKNARESFLEKEARLKADTFGGKTPEETINLFIKALEDGDIYLASKYYDLDKQGSALKSLQEELADNGSLKRTVDYFKEVSEKGKKICNESNDGCTFEYKFKTIQDGISSVLGSEDKVFVPKGSLRLRLIDIEKNKISEVWKIILP